jgi:PKD repeat protein
MFMLFLIPFILVAQTTPREMVVVEVGTGTWCSYCPGAAMGADGLLAGGHKVAVVENHNGDTYANVYSNARNTKYGIVGYPAATFDGSLVVVGGSRTTSMYPSYLTNYNAAIAVPSPVRMAMTETHSGPDYTVTLTLTKTDPVVSANLVLNFAVIQSGIVQNWQGQTHLDHVNRLMVPDQNGTIIDFTSGPVQTAVLTFSMLPSWPIAACEFVAWLQNYDAGQGNCTGGNIYKWNIFQGIKRGVIDLSPDFTNAPALGSPGVEVTFTNTTSGGYIGVPETYQWLFEGGTPATSTAKNPVVVYETLGSFDVRLIVDRGTQIDTIVRPSCITVIPADTALTNITVGSGTGRCYNATQTISLAGNGTQFMVENGGHATFIAGQAIHFLPGTMVANGGYVNGSITANGIYCIPAAISLVQKSLEIPENSSASTPDALLFKVYPNPAHGNVTVDLSGFNGSSEVKMEIFNMTGKMVSGRSMQGSMKHPLRLEGLPAGIYIIRVTGNDQTGWAKMIKQ